MTTTDAYSDYSHYVEPFEHVSGQYIEYGQGDERSDEQWNRPRQLITGVGCSADYTGTLAYIGIKKGDNYAGIVLNADELRDLVDSLTGTLDLMNDD
jgi:hypothetical protein